MKQIEREQIRQEYINILEQSWTWAKLTQQERSKAYDIFAHDSVNHAIKRAICKADVCYVINAVYGAFLDGLGYKPLGWRE